jgi:hypothetical protein
VSLEFYDELLKSERFCESLGRLLLLSGKLESALKSVIQENSICVKYKFERATLGQLVGTFKDNGLATNELGEVLSFILVRRNYLTHNLYPLFNEELEVSLLPRENLLPDDAVFYFPKCVDDLLFHIEFVLNYIEKRK